MKRKIMLVSLLLCASVTASARSISVCFNDSGIGMQTKDDPVGLEPVQAQHWMNITSAGNTGTIPTQNVGATFKDDRGVPLSGMALFVCSRGGTWRNGYTTTQTERLIYGYLDDNDKTAAGFKVTGIPYSSYKVIIYRGTDSGNANPFGPHTINNTVYTYVDGVLTAGLSQGWGVAHKNKLVEGQNAMVVGPLSGDLTVLTSRLGATCRACISGFQIVDLSSAEYQATISSDANWSSLAWFPSVTDWNALPEGSSAFLTAAAESTVTMDNAMNLYRAMVTGRPLTITNAAAVNPVIPFLNITDGSVTVKTGTLFSNVVAGAGTTNYFHASALHYLSGGGSVCINDGNYDWPSNYQIFSGFGATGSGSVIFYAPAANTKCPFPAFFGDSMLTLQIGINNVSPMDSPIDMSTFTGTLRINSTIYRSRVNQGAVMLTAWSLPPNATLLLNTNTQFFCTTAFTCNADIEFEDGADPNHTWIDTNGAIGQLRLNASTTLNGAIRIGPGTVRVGSDQIALDYLFNGPISGNTLELGAVGYGNNCVYHLNGDNSHALTRIMDNGRNVLVKANTPTAFGENLSFVSNSTGTSVITLSNGLNVAIQTLFGTNANSTIAFASPTSQLSITGAGESLYTGIFTGEGLLSKSGTGLLDLQMSAETPYSFSGLTVADGTLLLSNATARTFTADTLNFTGGTIALRGSQRLVSTSFTGGTGTLLVDVASLNPGTYPVMIVPGNAFTSGDFAEVTCVNTNPLLSYSVTYTSGRVSIIIGGLAWNGGADGTWDTTNPDWTANGADTTYADGNHVTFGDIVDTAQATNTLDAVLYPGSVTFDSTNTTWTLKTNPQKTGTITNGEFIITSGTVILADTNVLRSFTGTIKIFGGTLDATMPDSIPATCTVQLMTPGTLRTATYLSTAQLLRFDGDLVFSGTGTNAWGAISTFSGARLIVESGILQGTSTDSFGSRHNMENIVIVRSGGAIDLNGINRNTVNRWMTVTIEGTGWENSGAICNNTTASPGDNSGIRNLILSGDATVNAARARFDICREYAGTYVDFNAFTLTKTGASETYFRVSEVRNPGPLIIDQGFLGICGFQIGDTTNMPITVQPGATLGNYQSGNIYSPLTFNSEVGGAVTNYANWRAYDNVAANNITWRGPVTLNPTAKIISYTVNIGDVAQLLPGGYLTLGYAVLRIPDGTPTFGYPLYTDALPYGGYIDIGTNTVELTSEVTGTSEFCIRGTGTAKWNGTAAGLNIGLFLENSGCTLQLMKDFDGPSIRMNGGTVLTSDSTSTRAVLGNLKAASATAVTLGDGVNNGTLTVEQMNPPGTYNPTYVVHSPVRVTKLVFGGWAASFNVASDVNLEFEEVNNPSNANENFQKNGLGHMRINKVTGNTPKKLYVNAGTLEFNNTTGAAYTYANNITAQAGATLEKTGSDLITFSGGTTSLDTLIVPAQETSGLTITSGTFLCNTLQVSNGGALDTGKSYILLNGGTLPPYLPSTVEAPLNWTAANSGADLTLTYHAGRPYTLTWNGGTGHWSTSHASTDWLHGETATYFANGDAVRLHTLVEVPTATLTVINDITTPSITLNAPGTVYTFEGTPSLLASVLSLANNTTLIVNQTNARFDSVAIGENALLVASGEVILNPPYRNGTFRMTSDYAFANNANFTAGTLEVPAGTTFTYTGSVNNQARPFAILKGAGTVSMALSTDNFDFAAGGGSSAELTGTLRVTGPYRARVRPNFLSFITSMPRGSTLQVGNTMQLYGSANTTYNANIVFEDGALPQNTFLDTTSIGTIRIDGTSTFNGDIHIGNGTILIGSSGNDRTYHLNGTISGNTFQLGTVAWGTRYTYNMKGDNQHEKTLVNLVGRISTANIGHPHALGKSLEFIGNAAQGTININNDIAAVTQTLTTPATATTNYRINFNNAAASLAVNSGTFYGVCSGAGTLIKNSDGLLTLGNTNNHAVTLLNGGTLELAHPRAITNVARLVCTDGAWISGNPVSVGASLTLPTNIAGVASFKLYAMNRDGVTTNDRIHLQTDVEIPATAMKFGLFNPDGSIYTITTSTIVAQYEGAAAPDVTTWSSAVPGAAATFTINTADKTILMDWIPGQDVIDTTGYVWVKSSGDNWTTGASWSGGVAPPNSRDTYVRFANSITAGATVNNAASTIGTLSASASAYLYTLSGTVDLTNLWLGVGSRLSAALGGMDITCPSLQASEGTLTIPNGSTLRVNVATNELQTFNGVLNAASGAATLVKEGPGQLKLTNVNRPGAVVVEEGTLELAKTLGGTAASMGTLTIKGGARVLGTVNNSIGYKNNRYTDITIYAGGLFENAPTQTTDCGYDNIWHLRGGEMRSGNGINSIANASYFAMYGTVYSYATNTPSLITGRLVFRGDNNRVNMPFIVEDGPAPIDLDLQAGITIQGSATIRLKKEGPGTLRMSNASTFTAPLWVTDGVLLMEESATFSCATFQVDNPGVVYHNTLGADRIFGKALSGNGTFSIGATGSMTVTNAATFMGFIRVDSGATLHSSATYALPGIELNGGAFNLGGVTQTALNLTNAAPSTINLTADGEGNAGKLTITGNNDAIDLSTLTLNFTDPTQINYQRVYTIMEVMGSGTLTGLPQSNLERPSNLHVTGGRKLVISPVGTLILLR